MKNIIWYNLNKQGHILHKDKISLLPESPGIYVFKLSSYTLNELYIGSTCNLRRRLRQHRYRANKSEYSNLFYHCVLKYGWDKFELGLLEKVNLDNLTTTKSKRKFLLDLEQTYIDEFKPNLNLIKLTGSLLGFKRSQSIKKIIPENLDYEKGIKPEVSQETILKLKLHAKNKIVCIYDKNFNLIKEFDTLKKAGEYLGISYCSVSFYIKNSKLYNNLYYFKVKTNNLPKNTYFPLENDYFPSKIDYVNYGKKKTKNSYTFRVLYNNDVIYVFKSIRQASILLNISRVTLTKYSFEGKLWKNKFLFQISY